MGPFGIEHRVDDHREDRRRVPAPGGVERCVESSPLRRSKRPAEGHLGEGGEEAEPSRSHLSMPCGVVNPGGPRPVVERVEAGGGPDAEPDRLAAEGAGDDRPLALRVAGDIDPPPEGDTASGERLRERGLPPAYLAGKADVGVRERSLAVELPRVVAEGRPGPGVLADQHPGRAETLLGEEGVGAGEHLGRGTVRDELEPPERTSGHRPRLTAPRQERPLPPLLSGCLDLGTPLRNEPLAVLGLQLTCRPLLVPSRAERGPARCAIDAGARLEWSRHVSDGRRAPCRSALRRHATAGDGPCFAAIRTSSLQGEAPPR